MISLAEQGAFVRDELDRLGGYLGLGGLARFADELVGDAEFKALLEAKVADIDFFRTKHWDSTLRLGLYRFTQYALIRALKPAYVIETGVLHGLSTAFGLAALMRNAAEGANGRLVSIDAPSTYEAGPSNQDGFTDTLPPGLSPGWAIPDRLRERWELRLGTSRECLPAVLASCKPLGMFIHDSEHTPETMRFEFDTTWPLITDGGVLLADNIDVNTAFFDFARDRDRLVHVLPVDPDHRMPGASGIRCGLVRK